MKITYTVILIYIIAISVSFAAPTVKPPSAKARMMKTSTISQLKKIRFTKGAKAIMKAGVLNTQDFPPGAIPKPGPSNTTGTGNDVYRTGSGLVLRPSAMSHASSSSWLIVNSVTVYDSIRSIMEGTAVTEVFGILFLSNRDTPIIRPVNAYFRDLPSGLHTYMLTLSMTGENIADHVVLQIGENEFDSSNYVYTPTTGDIRLLFTYDAGAPGNNNELIMTTIWKHNNSTQPWYQVCLEFYYVQLAQLD